MTREEGFPEEGENLELDADLYILQDWDEAEDELVHGLGAAQELDLETDASDDLFADGDQELFSGDENKLEEELLFAEESVVVPSDEFLESAKTPAFGEVEGPPWSEDDLDLEELGVSLEKDDTGLSELGIGDAEDLAAADEALEMHDGELELVEFDADLDTPSNLFSAEQSDESEGVSEDATEEPVDEEWAPLEGGEDFAQDVGYAEEEYEAAVEAEEGTAESFVAEGYAEPDYGDHEEVYQEETSSLRMVGSSSRARIGQVAGLAAAVLVMAFAGVAWLQPKWLGMGQEVARIDMVKVDRPQVQWELAAPVVEFVDPDAQVNSNSQSPVEQPTQPEHIDPVQPPVVEQPELPVNPVVVTPPEVDPAVEFQPDTEAPSALAMDNIQVGDELYMKPQTSDGERRELVASGFGLVMGSRAMAQLFNNNIFVGRVKALDSSVVTLRLAQGEVTLDMTEVRSLTALAPNELLNYTDDGESMVRLRNSNRLKGRIVERQDDNIILQVQANRVIIPRSSIEEIAESGAKSVQFSSDDTVTDNDWVEKLVERKIRKAQQQQLLNKPESKVKVQVEPPPEPK